MKIKIGLPCIILSSALVLFNVCGQKESEWKGSVEVVNGVTVVKNPKEPMYPDKIIEFEEDLSIGKTSGDENHMFYLPTDIDADLRGNIYVLDYRDCYLKKYDSEGKYIKSIGRKGQGPGEFQQPSRLCLSESGNLFVLDTETNKVHVFSLDGVYVRSMNFPSIDRFYMTKNEEIILSYHSYSEEENNEIKHIYKVGRYEEEKNIVHDFYGQEQSWPNQLSNREGDATFLSPYLVRWAVDSKGNIYVATATQYEISVFSREPSKLFKFTLDSDPIPIRGEAENILSETLKQYKDFTDINKAKKTLEYFPLFYSFAVDEKDRLWIQHYPPEWKNVTREKTSYNVFSPEGRFLFSTFIIGHISSQLIFKNGYLYSLVKDESGYRRAVRFVINEN